jgi:DNA-binding XRE family transcriptional regulator
VKPFRAVVRLKNNRLVRLREELGLTSVALAEKIGMALSTYIGLENLKTQAMKKTGKWSDSATKIAEFHGVSCEWLWPDEVRAIRARALILEANARELVGLQPALALEGFETRLILGRAAEGVLTPREIEILKRRVMTDDPEPFLDIADHFATNPTRIRQIYDSALEKLRRLYWSKDPRREVQLGKKLLREEAEDRRGK